MVLRMARPVRNKTTGIYQFRKRVPAHLVALVGKHEEKISLKTRDPLDAKIAHARVTAEIEARWKQLAQGQISLTQKQAVAMAGEIYRAFVSSHEDSPEKASSTLWLLTRKAAKPKEITVINLGPDPDRAQALYRKYLNRVTDPPEIDSYLRTHGFIIDAESRERLRKEVARAMSQARDQVQRYATGDYRADPDAERFPPLDLAPRNREPQDLGKFLLTEIFKAYAKEKKIRPSTYKRWSGIVAKVAEEKPDARNITADWIVDWKDKLIESGLSQKTVQEGYLACLKSVCNWAISNRRLKVNPVTGITVAIPKQEKTRLKYFTAEEATTVLKAALKPQSDRTTVEMKAAYRWVPWICAYTGARVGEITQLRKQDIQQHGGHWLIKITPEAGTTKNAEARYVAIHPHLVEQGFLSFVEASKDDAPLFYNPGRKRGGTKGHEQYNKVSEKIAAWVRKIGVDDPRIQPNHAWRHGFKTRARKVKMDVGARDYMQGHVAATEGEEYGEFEADVLMHEISKLPRFEI